MLETMRRGQRWLTTIFIAVIGLVFVFFLGLGEPLTGSGSPDGTVVQAGSVRFNSADYYRTRAAQAEQFRERLGDQFDADAAKGFLDSQTLRRLVEDAIHAHAAKDMGLKVTRSEIQNVLRDQPQFRNDEGYFDTAAFADWVEYNYGSQRAFMDLMRSDLLRSKMIRLIYNHPRVSDAEARGSALQRLESVVLGHVTLDTENLAPGSSLDEAEVAAYRADKEAEIQEIYESRSDIYDQPEARKARHILFRVAPDAEAEKVTQVEKRAEQARVRITGGAAFEDVAADLSEDKASAERGGDIGFIARGESLPALEEGIFALQPGGAMSVVRSDSGFHIVRVDEVREAGQVPYEEASLEIARELVEKQAAGQRARATADELAAAVGEGKSLEEAARTAGASYRETPKLTRRTDGYLPGIGASPELMAEAFALTEENPRSGRVIPVDSKLTLIELRSRELPDTNLLEDETLAEKERLLMEKRRLLLQAWLDTHRTRLDEAEQLQIDTSITGGGI